jgi:hypothetical protein
MKYTLLNTLIFLVLLSGCSTKLEQENLIVENEPFLVTIHKTDSVLEITNTVNYSIEPKSDEWRRLNEWVSKNEDNWTPSPVTYLGDLYLTQGDHKITLLKRSNKIVLEFIDIEGKPKQYIKPLSNGELNFLYENKIPLELRDLNIISFDNVSKEKHSYFIDTTTTSKYYDQITKWNPHRFDNQAIDFYLNELRKTEPLKTFDLKDITSLWFSIRQYKGQLYLYDRCDGIDRRFGITDSSFIYYGPLESDADVIDSVITKTNDEVKLRLRTIPQKSKSGYAIVSIKRTNTKDVWLLNHTTGQYEWNELVIPQSSIKNFNLIVNYCPTSKQIEYQQFDRIDYEKYK